MNKKSTSTKDVSRVQTKKNSLKQPQPLPDKDFARRASHSIRSTTSAPKLNPIKKRLSKPPVFHQDDLSDSSLDSSDCPKRTSDLKTKILDSLQTFKLASTELCELSSQFTEDFSTLHKDFNYMKREIQSVLDESERSRQELSKIKQHLSDSPYRQINLSTKNSPGTVSETLEVCFEDPQEKVLFLKRMVEELKEDIRKNEEELVLDNTENEELRDKTYKLQDNFEDLSENEEATKTAACKQCCLF